MTRKQYIAIAEVLNERLARAAVGSAEAGAIVGIATDLCPIFKQENYSFDKDRFLTACGVV